MDEKKVESIIFGLKETIAEKDKEIERLKERNYWLESEHEYQCEKSYFEGVEKGRQQAVKKTVNDMGKEIYKRVTENLKMWLRERYDVEVE